MPPPPLTHVLNHVARRKQGSYKEINQCLKSFPTVHTVLKRIPHVLQNYSCSIKIGTHKGGGGRRPPPPFWGRPKAAPLLFFNMKSVKSASRDHLGTIFGAFLDHFWSILGGASRKGSGSIFGAFLGISPPPTVCRALVIISRFRRPRRANFLGLWCGAPVGPGRDSGTLWGGPGGV